MWQFKAWTWYPGKKLASLLGPTEMVRQALVLSRRGAGFEERALRFPTLCNKPVRQQVLFQI